MMESLFCACSGIARQSSVSVANVARVSVFMVGFLFSWDLRGRLTSRPFTGPGKVRHRRTTGNTTRDGYSAEWCTVFLATAHSVSSKLLPPVFRLRVQRGKFELDTSMRMR